MAQQENAPNKPVHLMFLCGGLLLFYLADDGRIVGVSGLGPASFAREFKVARLMVQRGLVRTRPFCAIPRRG